MLARLLSQRLSEVLGQSFVVENLPGTGGILAAKRIAGSSPDGYTLMVNDSGALAINITMNPEANYKLTDFTPVFALDWCESNLFADNSMGKLPVFIERAMRAHVAGQRLAQQLQDDCGHRCLFL